MRHVWSAIVRLASSRNPWRRSRLIADILNCCRDRCLTCYNCLTDDAKPLNTAQWHNEGGRLGFLAHVQADCSSTCVGVLNGLKWSSHCSPPITRYSSFSS